MKLVHLDKVVLSLKLKKIEQMLYGFQAQERDLVALLMRRYKATLKLK